MQTNHPDGGIATVNPDGTGFSVLPAPARATKPVWSPDGKQLAFVSEDYATFDDLFVVNGDGTGLRKVADGVRYPAWSPDGTKIAYWYRDLYAVPATGGTPTRILELERGDPAETDGDLYVFGSIDWSPDAERLALDLTPFYYFCDEYNECIPSQGSTSIYTAAADGSDLRRLTDGPADSNPSWSPDGTQIAFERFSSVNVMKADGTGQVALGDGLGRQPVWSPDGTKIAFVSARGLSVMDPDGSGVTDVLRPIDSGGGNLAYFIEPDWQAIPNQPPSCSGVSATPSSLWPANKKLKPVTLSGATDPDGDTVTLGVTAVSHDEPAGKSDDWRIRDDGTALLRADRDPRGDGRVYTLSFEAKDEHGASCTGTATISVPRHKR